MLGLADSLREKDVDIITVGVGYGVDEKELKDVAKDPKNYFPVKGFDELLDILSDLFKSVDKLVQTDQEEDAAAAAKLQEEEVARNNSESSMLQKSSQKNDKNASDCDKDECPYMNPIIVNIQSDIN
ncbi:hypothetical protein RF11_05281 [Thelohanellus kitauei]|uniref:VWFA domain-containing protein n=1 Tax=Thelohanellus kitauei TaxID=669202 RepID=A0A0C2MP81_THEKT|nr:hypothetical protein RF11_05281 [Thelohanellus kitauei]